MSTSAHGTPRGPSVLACLLSLALASCGGSSSATGPSNSNSGSNNSTPTVGSVHILTTPGSVPAGTTVTIQIRVDDTSGAPMSGVTVTFSVGSGGSVSPSSASTASGGTASTTWTVGTGAGSQTLQASASGISSSVSATVVAGPAAALTVVSGDGQTGTVGQALANPAVVKVQDQYGNPVSGTSVTFTASDNGSASPGSATSGTDGTASATWTLGTTEGQQTLAATADGATAASFTATAQAAAASNTMQKVAGDGQSATAGTAVAVAPSVKVTDASAQPVQGATVTFAVASGGGSVTGATQTTGADGVATVGGWTLGTTAGTNTLTASTAGASSVTFTATGTAAAAYHIDVRVIGTVSANVQSALDSAAARWSQIITGDLPAQQVVLSAGDCDLAIPAINEIVDDLLIYVQVKAIDGVDNTLASSGPCIVRDGTMLPAFGTMVIDSADVAPMYAQGILSSTLLHEMGHALGFGSIWEDLNLLQAKGTTNPYFTGTAAVNAYKTLGGTATDGVPVENVGGQGTADSHWRTSVFGNELMTGYASALPNPLSTITVGSLADLGYSVDMSAADPYTIPSPAPPRLMAAPKSWDRVLLPRYIVSPGGVLRPVRR